MPKKSTLTEYQKKRKFNQTPEPKGLIGKISRNRFVVQEHWAQNHHFDFRLELDGVLKSWAIPKEIPEKPGIRRLAVQTEDHPVAYISFAGKIPESEYGAGKVKIWDQGKFQLESRKEKKIVFELHGKKLKGRYTLVQFKPPKQWLLLKNLESRI